jgi:hypothetical protein
MKRNTSRTARPLKQSLLASAISSKNYPGIAGAGLAGLLLASTPHAASALNLYNGAADGNQLVVNLETTVSYSAFYRVNDPSAILTSPTGNANGSEGDINFRHGFFGNELQAVPVLDIRDGNYGAHVSGEFYINTPYLGTNQNNQPATLNPYSVGKNTDFTSATRNVNGENARLLDAFVFGRHPFGDGQVISLKFGRQTLLWGQSLFFTGNGVAAGQAPIDIITAQQLPNPQAQQVFLPVGQAVLTYRANALLTLQAFYQFEYQHDNFEGVGAYFNSSDILDKGGQRLILAPNVYAFRSKDITPPIENGQFGAAAFFTLDQGQYDLEFFGLRYDAKAPEVYYAPAAAAPAVGGGFSAGNYYLVYPRDIQIFGSSLSTTVGAANVAGEISGRRNMPLVSGLGISTAANPGNANSDPLYAVGNTLHMQASELYVSPAVPGDPGGVGINGEVEFNHVLSFDNKAGLAPGRQASAAAFEIVFTPTYYNVIPSLTLGFPVGITYNFLGRSQIDQTMQHGTGNVTFGINATYRATWIGSVTYKDFFGKPDASYNGLADRGFVSLNVQHTF